MIIDCEACPVRGQRCDDCAVRALDAPGSVSPSSSALLGTSVSPERPASPERYLSTGPMSPGLQLDAAEQRVVSMFVGAGLFDAGAVPGLRARIVSCQHHWEHAREVG